MADLTYLNLDVLPDSRQHELDQLCVCGGGGGEALVVGVEARRVKRA